MRFVILAAVSLLFSAESEDLTRSRVNYSQLQKANLLSMEQSATPVKPVHGPVNDSLYIVGPGDVFVYSLWGKVIETEHELIVNAEGNLVIPEMGVVGTNCSLGEVRKKVQALVKEKTRTVDLIFELKDVRTSLISVSGEVFRPGSYVFNSTVRLGDAMARAFEGSLERPENSIKSSLRNVRLLVPGKDPVLCDFEDFLRNGTLQNNPYLAPGCQVVVPTKVCSVAVTGAVARPGMYDYRSETILDLIRFAGGLAHNADSGSVSVIRYRDDGKTLDTKRYSYPADCGNEKVLPDDRVIVDTKPGWHDQVTVVLVGRVRNPGIYSLAKGGTALDLFQMAGGLLQDADSGVCFLKRVGYNADLENPNLKNRLMENQVFNPVVVSINIGSGQKEAPDYRLEQGDSVFVPQRLTNVSVVGRVAMPGLYPHHPGKSWDYYVDLAGGFDKNSYKSRAKIYKKDMDAWVFVSGEVLVDAGDIIMIPELPQDYYWNKIKDAITITSGIFSIMLTLVVLTSSQ